jgi:8-oxo-dGTP pyrophosphatase MutT (NUDIX family)
MTSRDVSDHELPRGAGNAPEVPARQAASVILLRDGRDGIEVLMIRRHAKASFVPDAWVFPGGMVEKSDCDLGDGTDLATMRVAAARELFEESGIWLGAPLTGAVAKRRALLIGETTFASLAREAPLDLAALVWTSRWITPTGVPKRFDTYFFLAIVGSDAVATVDDGENGEAVGVRWIRPSAAIETLQIVFPTMKNLEAIVGFDTAEELIVSRRGVEVAATRPVLVVEDGRKKIILP